MNNTARWFAVSLLLFLGVYYAVMFAIEPECPAGSVAKLTQQGWYCTVRPVG